MSEDMIDRVIYDETVDALRISILHARELADSIAALEAEASEVERLRSAALSEARNAVLSAIYHDERDADVAYAAIRALIPEAPAREGE